MKIEVGKTYYLNVNNREVIIEKDLWTPGKFPPKYRYVSSFGIKFTESGECENGREWLMEAPKPDLDISQKELEILEAKNAPVVQYLICTNQFQENTCKTLALTNKCTLKPVSGAQGTAHRLLIDGQNYLAVKEKVFDSLQQKVLSFAILATLGWCLALALAVYVGTK